MGPTWVLSAPGGPHVGLMNLAILDIVIREVSANVLVYSLFTFQGGINNETVVLAGRNHRRIQLVITLPAVIVDHGLGPLLLTWFNFNPSMDK